MQQTSFVTAKMPATHHKDFMHQLRILLIFIKFNILICILMERQRITHSKPPPSPDILPPTQPQSQPSPIRSRKPRNPWVMLGYFRDNLLAYLVHTDIPGYQNYVEIPPAFSDLITEHLHQHIKKSTFIHKHTHFFIHSFCFYLCLGQKCFVWGCVMFLVWDCF